MSCTAIITARSGSKGLPGKNIKDLHGQPMILYTLNAALASNIFSRIIVSSDSFEILNICNVPGVELVKRPDRLASDNASSLDVIEHVIKGCNIKGSCCLLQPTSPLRNEYHINDAFEVFKTSGCNSLISVVEPDESPQKALVVNPSNGAVEPLISWEALTTPRQLLPKTFFPNGAMYFFYAENFMVTSDLFFPPITLFEMVKRDSLDVDSIEDFIAVESVLMKSNGVFNG